MPNLDLNLHTLMATPNAILAVAVVLGLAVLFHEAGHSLAARLCGVGVKEFSLGFGPALWSRKMGGTRFSLRVVPFGGFANIAGMAPGETDMPGGIYTRPRYVQAFIFGAGVMMNVLLALLFFLVVTFWRGLPVPSATGILVAHPLSGSPAAAAGLRPHDQIVSVGGHRDSLIVTSVKPGSPAARAGIKKDTYIAFLHGNAVAVPSDLLHPLLKAKRPGLVLTMANPNAEDITKAYSRLTFPVSPELRHKLAGLVGKPAGVVDRQLGSDLGVAWAGLNAGTMQDYIEARPGKPITIGIERKGEPISVTVVPRRSWERVAEVADNGTLMAPHKQVGRIGVVLGPPTRRPGFVEGIRAACYDTVQSVVMTVQTVQALLNRKIQASGLAGPVGIIAMTAEQAQIGWGAVLNFAGLICVNFAIINVLPFPPLDGSYLLMVLVEAIARRRISEKVRMQIMVAGAVIVVMLFLVLTGHDALNLIRYGTP